MCRIKEGKERKKEGIVTRDTPINGGERYNRGKVKHSERGGSRQTKKKQKRAKNTVQSGGAGSNRASESSILYLLLLIPGAFDYDDR
jgi:hypothetical protein